MSWQIRQRDVTRPPWPIPDGSVQCVVTSPPYWGLRDYGTARWEGGDPACDHSPERRGGRFASPVSSKQGSNMGSGTASRRDCSCGAVRVDGQLGLERTFDEYVEKMVAVFREVRRVLRDDGTVWLNLGDCHYSSDRGGYRNDGHRWERSELQKGNRGNAETIRPNRLPQAGLKDKDLVGIPWRVAFALQADGWWLRSDVIWHKPNPMPESVRDRPTRAHEYVFLLTKSARYFFDQDAIREPYPEAALARLRQSTFDTQTGGPKDYGEGSNRSARRALVNLRDKQRGHGRRHDGFNDRWDQMTKEEQQENGANARTVWNIATHPFPGAHFATFPEELARRCILAGSRPGDTVLDPFAGSGTTVLVADKLGRNCLGYELNQAYVDMAVRRVSAPRTEAGKMECAGQMRMDVAP